VWWLLAALVVDSTHSLEIPITQTESLHVEISGAGEPVVLIPGLFGSAFGFRTLVPLLSERGYRAIVIEPLGIGGSARPPRADYSLTAQADRVAAALDSLHVQQAVIVGHSVGGSQALRLAYRRPDLVRALITIEGGPAETAVTPAFKRAMRFAPWIKLLGGVRLIRWKIRNMLIASSGDGRWVTTEVVEGYTAAAARNLDGTLKAFLAMAAAREPVKLESHLREIRCPVLLMVGGAQHEGDVSSEEVVLLEQTLPHFALDSVPGTGHFLYEERPEAVLGALLQVTVDTALVTAP
jgi:pimeloyl-ACP methyl ester carboxylesterase